MGFNIVDKGFQTIRKGKWKLFNGNFLYKDVDVNERGMELTNTELMLVSNFSLLNSSNPDFVYNKLNMFFQILDEKDYSGSHDLRAYILDVYDFIKRLYYIKNKAYHWQYKCNTVDNYKYYCIELKYNDIKIINVDVKTNLDGNLLSFVVKYHTDKQYNYPIINGYNSVNLKELETTVIKIDCPIVGDITFSDEVYDLDLLNGKINSEELLVDRLVSEHHLVLEKFSRKR